MAVEVVATKADDKDLDLEVEIIIIMEIAEIITRKAQVDTIEIEAIIMDMKVAKHKVVCMGVEMITKMIIMIPVKDTNAIIIIMTEEIEMIIADITIEIMIIMINPEVEPVSNVKKRVIWLENVQIQMLVVIEEEEVIALQEEKDQ